MRPGLSLFCFTALVNADWEKMENEIKYKPFKPYCYSSIDQLVELWSTWLFKILQKSCFKKEDKSQKISTTMATPLTSNLIKRVNILRKCIEKRPTKAGMTKLEIMKKLVKILFDEDQTAFEAVTIEGRICAKLQK